MEQWEVRSDWVTLALSLIMEILSHVHSDSKGSDGRLLCRLNARLISKPRVLYLQHESVRRVDEYGGVVLGGGLQAELGVCGSRVVREGDAGGQLAVVQ